MVAFWLVRQPGRPPVTKNKLKLFAVINKSAQKNRCGSKFNQFALLYFSLNRASRGAMPLSAGWPIFI
tara:strand:- start:1297 stop:1500 length:204 start_codon:yes stop_codon:yes gene_type:complete